MYILACTKVAQVIENVTVRRLRREIWKMKCPERKTNGEWLHITWPVSLQMQPSWEENYIDRIRIGYRVCKTSFYTIRRVNLTCELVCRKILVRSRLSACNNANMFNITILIKLWFYKKKIINQHDSEMKNIILCEKFGKFLTMLLEL